MVLRKERLQADARFRILRLLQKNPEMSQREMAQAVGISLGSLHFVLKALVQKGMVKLDNFSPMSNKRRYSYLVTPKGISEKARLARNFLTRKRQEYEVLRLEIETLQAEIGVTNSDDNRTEDAESEQALEHKEA